MVIISIHKTNLLDPMEDYQMYQMHHDPAMYARMVQNPNVIFDGKYPSDFSNPNMFPPPPPHPVTYS